MIEREWKFRLADEQDLRNVERLLGEPLETRELSTRYWLPAAPAGCVFRLREWAGACLAEVKTALAPMVDGRSVHREHQQRLEPSEALALLQDQSPPEDLRCAREAGMEGPCRYIGALLVTRTVHRWRDLPVELDRISFPNGDLQFELEAETDDTDAGTKVRSLLREAGVQVTPSESTKFARLLKRLGSSA